MSSDKQVATVLAAIAHPVRVAIVRVLARTGPEGMAAGQLAARLQVSASALTFHLNKLTQAGLVTGHKHGQFMIYSAAFDALIALLEHLAGTCCIDAATVCGPRCPADVSRSSGQASTLSLSTEGKPHDREKPRP